MKTLRTLSILMIFALASVTGFSQIETPTPSPKQTYTQEVGLGEISVSYSRPGVKDRKIYGELVPFGKIWRTGANQATTIEFSEDIKVEGEELKAGKYSLFTIPGESEWEIIFYSEAGKQAWDREEDKDALVVKVKSMATQDMTETFTIAVSDIRNDHANLELLWEKTSVKIKMEFVVDEAVMKSIEEVMAGPGWYDKYRAARYYFENDKDLNQAHTWITESTDAEERFWTLRWKAEIEAALGNYKEAIATAERSKQLAIEEENDDYVKINDDNVAEWTKKL